MDPDLGAEIVAVRRPGGANVLATYDWAAPLSVRETGSTGDGELDWLSEYRGGWQELFPNAGAPCDGADGVPLPFHGEGEPRAVGDRGAGADEVTLRRRARLPLVLERTDAPGRRTPGPAHRGDRPLRGAVTSAFLLGPPSRRSPPPRARASTCPKAPSWLSTGTYVTDLGDLAAGWQRHLAQHARTGRGSRDRRAGPRRCRDPSSACFTCRGWVTEPWAAIRGVAPGLGVAMAWDATTFPCAWFWWEIGGPGHPWHGRARIVAIEPNTSRARRRARRRSASEARRTSWRRSPRSGRG